MAVALTAGAPAERWQPMTIGGTGLTAATDYTVTYTSPNGFTGTLVVTTDGAGAFTDARIVSQSVGMYAFTIESASVTLGVV